MRPVGIAAIIASIVAVFVAASCAAPDMVSDTATPTLDSNAALTQPSDRQLPALPDADTPVRAGSIVTAIDGSNNMDGSPNAVGNGTALNIDATSTAFEWGMWTAAPPDPLISVTFDLTLAAGEEVWIAVSNFDKGWWDITGTYDSGVGDPQIAVSDQVNRSGAGAFYCVVLCDTGHQALVESISVADTGVPNTAPVASFITNPTEGDVGAPLVLDASASTDDIGIVKYEWDLNDDGIYEIDNGASAVYNGIMPGPAGNHTIRLRVTDGGALTDDEQTEVISHGWLNTPDPDNAAGNAGWFNTAAMVNGQPAIAYCDNATGDLKFTRATDAQGDNWGAPVTIDNTGSAWYISMAIVAGMPAISYFDGAAGVGDLKYVRALDANGAAWGNVQTLDSVGQVGEFSSLAVIAGNPAVAYFDETNTALKYVRAMDNSGNVWNPPMTVDNTAVDGWYAELLEINGNPGIAYQSGTEVHFIRAVDPFGMIWNIEQVVDNTASVGQYISMKIVNGFPALAYYDISNRHVVYCRALDADGVWWGAPQLLDVSIDDVGKFTSLQIIAGNPAISYTDTTKGDVRYIRSLDDSGMAWGLPQVVADDSIMPNGGTYTQLLEVGGQPGIVYHGGAPNALRFIRYQ